MATKANRHTRRAALAQNRKRRAGTTNKSQQVNENLLLRLAAAGAKASMPANFAAQDEDEEDDEDDTDTQDDTDNKGADDEDSMSLSDMLGSDDEDDGTDDEDDEDDEEGGSTVSLDDDQLDALIDAALGVSDDEDDEDESEVIESDNNSGGYSAMSAKAKKAAQVKKMAAAKRVLAALEEQFKGVRLPAQVKKLLVQSALREAEVQAQSVARKRAATVVLKQKQARKAEKKTAQAVQELVRSQVEEVLVNSRSAAGRSMNFGGYATTTVEAGRKSGGNMTFGRGVNQLSGQYRRGTPEFKLTDMMKASLDPRFAAKFNREIKALGGAVPTAGGYTVSEEWASDFIRLLRPKSVFRQFARIYPMVNDTFHLPKQTGTANAAWVGENVDLTAGILDQTFDEIVFTAKKLRAFSIASNELLADSPYAAEKIVREDLRDAIVLAEDLAAMVGSGSGAVPSGIYNQIPNANKLVGSGASNALAGNDLYRMMRAVQKNNGRLDVFVINSDALLAIQTLTDNNGNYLFSENNGVNAPQPVVEAPFGEDPEDYNVPVGKLLGRDVYIENQIPNTVTIASGAPTALTGGTNTLIFGGTKQQFLIGQRKTLDIMASNVAGAAFGNDQTYFRAIMREDFKLGIPGTWSVLAIPTPA